MRQSEVPALLAEGPKFGVTENEEKNAGNEKTDWPYMTTYGPALPNAPVRQNQKTGDQDQQPRQMVIELAFALPGLKRRLRRRIDSPVHGHGHSIVHPSWRHLAREERIEAPGQKRL